MKGGRDRSILEHIVEYCREIERTVDRFGNSYAIFQNDSVYRNAAAMCVLQIGELSSRLSDEFKETHDQIPWVQIKALRNIMAHRYGSIDPEILWETIEEDIPTLTEYCNMLLAK